ncbi:MAG: nitrilase-related carbon-nitrogen hydrolase, partial [Actinomycetota bacterium]
AEVGFTEAGTDHNVFKVKGARMGISTCADGTNRDNVKALVENGAQIIYGPHANTTGSTIAGWYNFRKAWGGAGGWIAEFKVYAALHNHAALYNAEFAPPVPGDSSTRWASGSWPIGPDGSTLAQMPTSTNKADSKEFVLVYNVPIAAAKK